MPGFDFIAASLAIISKYSGENYLNQSRLLLLKYVCQSYRTNCIFRPTVYSNGL